MMTPNSYDQGHICSTVFGLFLYLDFVNLFVVLTKYPSATQVFN